MKPRPQQRILEALKWALDDSADPAMAAADWLARDIDPECGSVVGLLSNPQTSLETLERAKAAFKTMRIVGETVADRKLGGMLYASVIAAALVHHGARISRQSDGVVRRALQQIDSEEWYPEELRTLASLACSYLECHA